VVVEALPERGQAALNLARVSLVGCGWVAESTYLQLPHRGLAKVLWARVDAQRDQEAPVDALLAQTSFALLSSDDALLLQLPCFALCLGLPPRLQSRVTWLGGAAPDAQERGAPSVGPRAVDAAS
jgi:hypothetical protein